MSRQFIYDIVVARALNQGIGKNNSLPWKLSTDLKMFRKITTSNINGNTIIYGRKCFDAINRKALPNRTNIVISKDTIIKQQNVYQARSFQQALILANTMNPKTAIYVIGGAQIYQLAMANVRYIYETLINHNIDCDTFMPVHQYPISFVSKTFSENNLTYDFRLYYNPKIINIPQQNKYGVQSHEEYQYINAIKNIIKNGQDKIDRTKTGTKSLFGGMMRYDLKYSFPLLTYKKVFWRGVAQELFWFIKGSTNAIELDQKNIKIWAGNSSKQYLQSIGINRQAGDLGPVYGYQWRNWNAPYSTMHENYINKGFDQLAWIIQEIKRNPSSRRLILTAWNPSQLKQMALPPCHLLSQFSVSNDGRLSCILYQRSGDMGLGVPFNIASYSLLTCLIAQVTGLKRGQFIHMLGDMHVYNDHIQPLKVLDDLIPYPFPTLQIDPSIKNIDDFKFEHLKLNSYKSHKKLQMKMSV